MGIILLRVFLVTIVLLSCQGPEEPGGEGRAKTSQTKTQKTGDPPVRMAISEIPVFTAAPEHPPAPLPYIPAGLSFQQGKAAKTRLFRPIGRGKFGPDGDLYLTFPTRHIVAAFRGPGFELTLFGKRASGGKDEIVKDPEMLHFVDGLLYLSNHKNGQVLVLDRSGGFRNLFELGLPGPIPGPDGAFLLRSDTNPNVFARVDDRKRLQQRYLLVRGEGADPEGHRLIFQVLDNWDLVCVRQEARRVFHMQKNALFRRQIAIDWGALRIKEEGDFQAHGIKFHQGAYWLLVGWYRPQTPARTLLLVFDETGTVRQFWETPIFADGFDVAKGRLLLYDKRKGAAQTYLMGE